MHIQYLISWIHDVPAGERVVEAARSQRRKKRVEVVRWFSGVGNCREVEKRRKEEREREREREICEDVILYLTSDPFRKGREKEEEERGERMKGGHNLKRGYVHSAIEVNLKEE